MSDEWKMVPRTLTPEMDEAGYRVEMRGLSEAWEAMLSASPPLPESVLSAMVERGARAMCRRCRVVPACDCNGDLGSIVDEARACILAALGESR